MKINGEFIKTFTAPPQEEGSKIGNFEPSFGPLTRRKAEIVEQIIKKSKEF
jgi:hypothetical protein